MKFQSTFKLPINHKKTIVIWSPIVNRGHLNSYMFQFAQIFSELDYSVIIVSRLNFRYIPNELKLNSNINFLKINTSFSKFLKKIIYLIFIKMKKGSFKNSNKTKMTWSPLLDLINKHALKPNLIINMYLDIMLNDLDDAQRVPFPWTGVLFHPNLSNAKPLPEQYFYSSNCRGGLFLPHVIIKNYQENFQDKIFLNIPDIASVNVVSTPNEKLQPLKKMRGKVNIGLVGDISTKKNLDKFLELAQCKDLEEFNFIIIGKIDIFNVGLTIWLKSIYLKYSSKYNFHMINRYLKDESAYNFYFLNLDIIFAVYKDFSGSSNTLTKASHGNIPVLTQSQGYMGKVVTDFILGETVTSQDIQSLKEAILALNHFRKQKKYEPGLKFFSNLNSYNSLKILLSENVKEWFK